MAGEPDCVFCRIVRGELPADKVFEDGRTLVFRDIKPAASTHLLVVPKKHVEGLSACGEDDRELLSDVMLTAGKAAKQEGLDSFRLIVNDGRGAGQTVFHLHAHIVSGPQVGEKLL